MDKKEFDKWVNYVAEKGMQIPNVLIKRGVDDWQTRILLARTLSRKGVEKLEPAIDLFYSILDVKVTEPEDVENKAWSLYDLGMCIWSVEKDATKALKYVDMSIQLAESIQDDFVHINRGELWYGHWWLLSHLNQTGQAIKDANKIIAERDTELRNNSYLYYAYKFKSELAHKQGDIDQALEFLYQALIYFPDDYDNRSELEELWINRNADKQKTYEKMEELTHFTHLCWEV